MADTDLGTGESSSCPEAGSTPIANSTDQTAEAQENREEAGTSGNDQTQDSNSNLQQSLSNIYNIILKIREEFNIDLGPGHSSSTTYDDDTSSSTNIDNIVHQNGRRIPRGPASRHLPRQCCFFIKKLDGADVSQEYGRLDIDMAYAVWIHCCPRIREEDHYASERVEFVAFDYENTEYKMVLLGFNHEGSVQYSITGEWRRFFQAHDLKCGDTIFIYRTRDRMINGNEYYYVILFTREGDGIFTHPEDKIR